LFAMKDILLSSNIAPYDFFEILDPRYINLNNGIYDLKTSKFNKHTPKTKFLYKVRVNYNPDADYSNVQQLVEEIVGTQYSKVIQQIFGYTLYTRMPIQKAFIFFGKGANGKDTLLHLLETVLEGNISSENLEMLISNRFAPINLLGKLANISTETNDISMSRTAMFKNLRGGGLIRGEIKGGSTIYFSNHAKLIFALNKFPFTSDNTLAFWRSWLLIPFNRTFVKRDDKKDYKYQFTDTSEKREAILLYMLDGLKDLYHNSWTLDIEQTPDIVQEMWHNQSSLERFVKDCIKETDEPSVLYSSDILETYHRYCNQFGVEPDDDKKFYMKFSKYMLKHYKDVEKCSDRYGHRYYSGIELTEEALQL